MNLGRDLKSKTAIYIKGILFLCLFGLAIFLNLTEFDFNFRVLSLALVIWSSARIYYFMFYVIENYVDSNYKFSSVYSFIKYLVNKR